MTQIPSWDWVILALALWRLSSLVAKERPFVFLREWLGVDHDQDGHPVADNGRWYSAGIQCTWCVSVWLSLPTFLLAQTPAHILLTLLSLSTGAILIGEAISRLRGE